MIDARVAAHRREAENPQRFPKSANGLRHALAALQVDYRYNLRASRAEFREDNGHWTPTTERFEAWLCEEIRERFHDVAKESSPLVFGRDVWRRSLLALLADAEVDPFVEFLEDLAPWDNKPRLDTWLASVFDVPESDYQLAKWAGDFVFLGPVMRAYQPGAKLDEMPVLIGPQGCGKSTAFQWTVPHDRPEWFADGLHLAADSKTRAEALQGRVIVEASEMAGSTRAELESLKAFLSRTDDGGVRLAYRANPEPLPRRCIIVGTTNLSNPLPNDPTGNRRFVAVNVRPGSEGAAGVRDYLDEHREQLWAEALALYRAGLEPRLPNSLEDAATRRERGRTAPR